MKNNHPNIIKEIKHLKRSMIKGYFTPKEYKNELWAVKHDFTPILIEDEMGSHYDNCINDNIGNTDLNYYIPSQTADKEVPMKGLFISLDEWEHEGLGCIVDESLSKGFAEFI